MVKEKIEEIRAKIVMGFVILVAIGAVIISYVPKNSDDLSKALKGVFR